MDSDTKTSQHFMGEAGFVFFYGIVEDINDPFQNARVRVRCFGFHANLKQDIPTEDLPWAPVMIPATSASNSGVGFGPHGLRKGSQVIGFFQDGMSAQYPVVLGTIHGVNPVDFQSSPNLGFQDPDGVYPKADYIGESDVSKLARTNVTEPREPETTKKANALTNIAKANGTGTWSEIPTDPQTTYPDNFVIEHPSGHIVEFDGSEGAERIHVYHRAGTFVEIHQDGAKVSRTVADQNDIVDGDLNEYVGGDKAENVTGSMSKKIDQSLDVQIEQGNMTVTVDRGNYIMNVATGNANVTIQGNANLTVNGNAVMAIQGGLTQNVTGSMTQAVQGNVTQTVSGTKIENVNGAYTVNVSGVYNVNCSGIVSINGSAIFLN